MSSSKGGRTITFFRALWSFLSILLVFPGLTRPADGGGHFLVSLRYNFPLHSMSPPSARIHFRASGCIALQPGSLLVCRQIPGSGGLVQGQGALGFHGVCVVPPECPVNHNLFCHRSWQPSCSCLYFLCWCLCACGFSLECGMLFSVSPSFYCSRTWYASQTPTQSSCLQFLHGFPTPLSPPTHTD